MAWLTTEEVAGRLGVSPGRVRQLTAQGRIRAIPRKANYYREAEVEKFLSQPRIQGQRNDLKGR